MADNGSISIEGMDELLRKMGKLPAEAQTQCMRAMESASMGIIAAAKENLRANDSVVTGALRASGKTQKVDNKTIDVGFFSSSAEKGGYARYVEYGRPPGEMPPPSMLEAWGYKKYRLTRKEARSFGWAMARKIAEKGTKPHPFFVSAVEAGWRKMIDKISNLINL